MWFNDSKKDDVKIHPENTFEKQTLGPELDVSVVVAHCWSTVRHKDHRMIKSKEESSDSLL